MNRDLINCDSCWYIWSLTIIAHCAIIVKRFSNNQRKKIIQMSDIYSKEERSLIMSKVSSKNNKSTELKLIRFFHANGIKGWRRNYKVIGKPDFVFLSKRIAVFVDGCFWHGHDCRNLRPSDNKDYWDAKISRNIQRDKEVTNLFEQRGWTVIRIWECELKKKNLEILKSKLKNLLETKNENWSNV